MAKKTTRPELDSWDALNKAIMEMDEAEAQVLLKHELAGKKRSQFVKRIHSRINKLRAMRERVELLEKIQ